MPTNIYDDPELQPEEYADSISFERVGDRVRGRILSIEKLTTKFGPTAKYMLRTEQGDQSLLAGAKNLWGQLLSLKPDVGDVLTIELIELRTVSQGTAKIFDVQCEPGERPAAPPPIAREEPPAPRPDPGRAAAPKPVADDGDDIFDS